MTSRSYGQYCGVAAALDRLGDRWTLLVLRELSFGERRFTDLRSALPGIATNLLSERLRGLEVDGLVEQRELPAPAARTVYALTAEGRRVTPVLGALSAFGLRYLPAPQEGEVRPAMAVYGSLGAMFDAVRAEGVDLVVRFDLDGERLGYRIAGGRLRRVDERDDADADVLVSGSAARLLAWCRGDDAVGLGPLRVEGPAEAQASFRASFGLPEA